MLVFVFQVLVDVVELIVPRRWHGVKVGNGPSGKVNADTGPVAVVHVERDVESVKGKDIAGVDSSAKAAHALIAVTVWSVSVADLHEFGIEEGRKAVTVPAARGETGHFMVSSGEKAKVAVDHLVAQPCGWSKGDEVTSRDQGGVGVTHDLVVRKLQAELVGRGRGLLWGYHM